MVPFRSVGAPGASYSRRLLQLWRPLLPVAAGEVVSDAVRPPLADLRVRAGAPPSPLSIPPSSSGQEALLAGVCNGEAALSSVSLSPSLSPDERGPLVSHSLCAQSGTSGGAHEVYAFDVTPLSSVLFKFKFNSIQRASNSQNILTVSPNELFLFALCSL